MVGSPGSFGVVRSCGESTGASSACCTWAVGGVTEETEAASVIAVAVAGTGADAAAVTGSAPMVAGAPADWTVVGGVAVGGVIVGGVIIGGGVDVVSSFEAGAACAAAVVSSLEGEPTAERPPALRPAEGRTIGCSGSCCGTPAGGGMAWAIAVTSGSAGPIGSGASGVGASPFSPGARDFPCSPGFGVDVVAAHWDADSSNTDCAA
jgi:hypothetical protein